MLESVFGETGGAVAQFLLALVTVVVLIVLVAWIIKKLGGGRYSATQSGKVELEIVDAIVIDQKRRLVLVRHGRLQHLLLIGGGSDEVVERSMIDGVPLAARLAARQRSDSPSSTAEDHPHSAAPPSEMNTGPATGIGTTVPQPKTFAGPDMSDPNDSEPRDGAAAAASTGLAAALATSGIAAAVVSRENRSAKIEPVATSSVEVASAPPPGTRVQETEPLTQSPSPSAVEVELERSIERAFQLDDEPESGPEAPTSAVLASQTLAPAAEPTPAEEPIIEEPLEDTLAKELEAALGEAAASEEFAKDPIMDEEKAEEIGADVSAVPEPETTALGTADAAISAADETEERAPDETEAANSQEDETAAHQTVEAAQTAEAPTVDAPVAEDIVQEEPLSSERPEPIAVTIPSRGPAAGAITVNQDDKPREDAAPPKEPPQVDAAEAEAPQNNEEGEPLVDLTELIEPEPSKKPASTLSEDLDEEMRRLLGEIAGGPKPN